MIENILSLYVPDIWGNCTRHGQETTVGNHEQFYVLLKAKTSYQFAEGFRYRLLPYITLTL